MLEDAMKQDFECIVLVGVKHGYPAITWNAPSYAAVGLATRASQFIMDQIETEELEAFEECEEDG